MLAARRASPSTALCASSTIRASSAASGDGSAARARVSRILRRWARPWSGCGSAKDGVRAMVRAPADASWSISRAYSSRDPGPLAREPRAARLASSMPITAISGSGDGAVMRVAASYTRKSSHCSTPVTPHSATTAAAASAPRSPSVRPLPSHRADLVRPTCCCSTRCIGGEFKQYLRRG